jgi:hypothetical protein
MNVAKALRVVAVLIAALGAIDPVRTKMAPVDHPIAIRVIDSPSLDLPVSGSASGRVAALAAAERMRARLGDRAAIRVGTAGHGSICPERGVCIVIADGHVDRPVTAGARVAGAVDVSGPLSPNVAIVAVESTRDPALTAPAMLRVRLRADGIRGTSRIDVRDAGVLVGSGTHEWAGDQAEVTAAVRWIPLGPGPRRLHVLVHGPEPEETTIDNRADVGVDVSASPFPVLIDEPEATWAGTFIRRALEGDARFAVQSRAHLAPGLTTTRGEPMTRDALEAARAVIVTAPDTLSTADVDRLERYVRMRGGSLVLPLVSRPTGPIARLIPAMLAERRHAEPQRVGSLLASEIVTFETGPGVVVLEALEREPVIVARAIGRGRVIVSGALDAWRYRDAERFTAFWTSVLADAAAAAPTAFDVELASALAAPHEDVPLRVSRHSLDPLEGELTAKAMMRCGETSEPLRLWPASQPGQFAGVVRAPASGACDVEASIDGGGGDASRATTRIMVAPNLRTLKPWRTTLATAMAAHGAPVVPAGGEDELIARVRAMLPGERVPQETHPMRSPWWLVPFAGCLSGEWWLRRRRGLR